MNSSLISEAFNEHGMVFLILYHLVRWCTPAKMSKWLTTGTIQNMSLRGYVMVCHLGAVAGIAVTLWLTGHLLCVQVALGHEMRGGKLERCCQSMCKCKASKAPWFLWEDALGTIWCSKYTPVNVELLDLFACWFVPKCFPSSHLAMIILRTFAQD